RGARPRNRPRSPFFPPLRAQAPPNPFSHPEEKQKWPEKKFPPAAARAGTGKGAARHIRREGRIPGVVYGGGDAPTVVSLDYREVNKLIYSGHFLTTIFELEVGDAKHRVIPRDYQLDPVKDQPLHVDFLRLKPGAR